MSNSRRERIDTFQTYINRICFCLQDLGDAAGSFAARELCAERMGFVDYADLVRACKVKVGQKTMDKARALDDELYRRVKDAEKKVFVIIPVKKEVIDNG